MPSYENCYNGNPNVKRDGVEWKYTEEELKEYIKCSKNPAYFIRKYVKIVHLDKGLVEFNLRGYQEKMVNHINDNRFSIILSGRQSGKSVTSAAWILWYVLFHESKTVAVLANKGAIAREILFRITSMLEGVPFFLQPGCKELNKGSIVFSNGSKVIAAATSSSSIRGLSCVTANTFVTVKYEDGHIENTTVDKLLTESSIEILTHYGFKKFDGFRETNRVNRLIRIKTKTRTLECTKNHKLLDSDFLFRRADSLKIGDILVTENDNEEIESITKVFGCEIPVYDAINVEDVHSYYTNGLVSHNCSCVVGDSEVIVKNGDVIETVKMEDLYAKVNVNFNKYENITTGGGDFHMKQQIDLPKIEIKESKYEKIYKDFIEDRRNKEVIGYGERHHIVPRSLGGLDTDDNIVFLSLRDHYFAHKLLVKIHRGENKAKMLKALWFMSTTRKLSLPSRKWEECKRAHIELGKNRIDSEETKAKISAARKEYWKNADIESIKAEWKANGRNENDSKGVSKYIEENRDEFQRRMLKINTDQEKIKKTAAKHRGMKRSVETRTKQSLTNKGKFHFHCPETGKRIQVTSKEEAPIGWKPGTGHKVNNRGKWYNNGKCMKAFRDNEVPDGWTLGRIKQ